MGKLQADSEAVLKSYVFADVSSEEEVAVTIEDILYQGVPINAEGG